MWSMAEKRPKTRNDQKNNDVVVVGYFAGPTSVLPDVSGRSDAIGKDWATTAAFPEKTCGLGLNFLTTIYDYAGFLPEK